MEAVQSRSGRRRRVARPEKSCDLCDGRKFDLISQHDRRGEVLHTGICLRCGLVCHMSIPSEEELAEFYAREYRRQYHGEITPSARRVVRAWKNAVRIYRQLSPFVAADERVFEVGAGVGCNVKAFELAGHDACGIEPNEGFCDFSVRRLHARLQKASLFDLAPQPQYDLVLLVHVIEHFRSPRRALDRIRGLLRPRGKLYVECPNIAAPFARWGKQFHFAHVHNFTPSSLRMMAGRCGYDVERVFSSPDDPNLQMLLRRAEAAQLVIDDDNRSQTLSAVQRYNALAYHLRPRYLARRLAKVTGYSSELLFAKRQLRRVIRHCQRLR